jgi:hypothetical protein
MEAKDKIIADIASKACNRIARIAIRRLQKMKDCCLSGEDSCLKNAWDEICVQEQSGTSFYYNAYEKTLEAIVADLIQGLDENTKAAIWLQTEAGNDWEFDNPDSSQVAYNNIDIAQYIISCSILPIALDWNNSRIEKYKEMS